MSSPGFEYTYILSFPGWLCNPIAKLKHSLRLVSHKFLVSHLLITLPITLNLSLALSLLNNLPPNQAYNTEHLKKISLAKYTPREIRLAYFTKMKKFKPKWNKINQKEYSRGGKNASTLPTFTSEVRVKTESLKWILCKKLQLVFQLKNNFLFKKAYSGSPDNHYLVKYFCANSEPALLYGPSVIPIVLGKWKKNKSKVSIYSR